MDPIRNPYAPGAGTPPPELTGREALIERARILFARIEAGRSEKSFIAVGLRGVGKTVLLSRIAEMAEAKAFRVCLFEAREGKRLAELLIPQLRRVLLELDRRGQLSEQVKRGLRILKSFVGGLRLKYADIELGLDIEPETGAADSGDLEADLPELFVAIGRAARARETAVALIIDEIQYLSTGDMSALIMALHRTTQLNLPIVLVAAGLPQVVGQTGKSKSYAERLFDFPAVGALDRLDADRAITIPAELQQVRFEPAALDLIFGVTQGYPYFLQEWAYHAWNTAASPRIGRPEILTAGDIALARLDESFFRVRFDRLTPREKDYLRAMAELGAGPHRTAEIADCLKIGAPSVAPLRSGLIAKGMIFSPAHGDTAFTVPLFDAYLRRTIPNWRTPYADRPASI